ncbi:cathepsin L [Bemisia tabaci]|uniref:cathepsin L n=1 Tax=Bemisia tabaci TaxID=7038 RepID=UPI003B282D31
MRLLLFVGLLAVFCGHFTTSDGAVQPTKAPTKGDPATEFDKFVAKYNKKYPEDREKAKRFQIFKENLKEIERLNNRPRKGTVVYGVTKFADLTSDEFLKKHATHNVGDMSHLPNTNTLSDWADAETDFNWESKGAVTEIQDEGSCAASAAYATVAVIETFLWKATKNLVKLSEQQLIDCSTVTCSRGNHWDAFTKIVNMKGIQSKAVYSPKTKDCALKNGAAARVAYIEVNNRDEESMKNWVYNQGPIAVVINAKDMQFYVSGISNIDASECPLSPNRFVTLVGYGMQRYGGADFPYWIAKNSFGKDWGEKGYFRFARNINYCGVRHRPLSVAYDNSFSSTEVTGGNGTNVGTTKIPVTPKPTTKLPPTNQTVAVPVTTTKPPTKGPTKPASTTKPPTTGPTKPASTTKPPTKGPYETNSSSSSEHN